MNHPVRNILIGIVAIILVVFVISKVVASGGTKLGGDLSSFDSSFGYTNSTPNAAGQDNPTHRVYSNTSYGPITIYTSQNQPYDGKVIYIDLQQSTKCTDFIPSDAIPTGTVNGYNNVDTITNYHSDSLASDLSSTDLVDGLGNSQGITPGDFYIDAYNGNCTINLGNKTTD